MAFYEVTLIGQRNGQMVLNRLNFSSSNPGAANSTAPNLLEALGYQPGTPGTPKPSSFLSSLMDASTSGYQLDELSARNLFSVTDFITQPLSGAGWTGTIVVAAGDATPTFVAAKLRTNRVRTDIRRGTLALTGGTEEQIEGLDNWNAAYLALLQNVANWLNVPPSHTAGATTVNFYPSVFGKERYAVPDSNPVRYAYRYWQDPVVFQDHVASPVTWSPVERVSSQVSRKIGRGA